MAQIKLSGLEEIEKQLQRREKAAEEAVPEMLKAGAAVLVESEREEMERLELVDYGDMRDSVKATKVKESRGGKSIGVYPQGKDRKGVSNATKAFVAQYGKSGMSARPWLTAAKAKSGDKISQTMKEVWRKKQQ